MSDSCFLSIFRKSLDSLPESFTFVLLSALIEGILGVQVRKPRKGSLICLFKMTISSESRS